MKGLCIESGHPVTADSAKVPGNFVRFVTEDGRTMFEVSCGKDGRSIEVRAVEATRVDGVMYAGMLTVEPNASNSISVGVRVYGEQ